MSWSLAESLVQVGVMLVGSLGACALALLLARIRRPGHARVRVDVSTIDQTIDALVRAAAIATSSGFEAAAAQTDGAKFPLLSHGLRLACDGMRSTQVHEQLIERADRTTVDRVRARLRLVVLWGSGVLIGVMLLAAWSALMGTLFTSQTRLPTWITLGSVASALVILPVLSWAAIRMDHEPLVSGSHQLSSSLEIDAATLIVAGANPGDIEAHLRSLLPPSQRRISGVPASRVA
jgi:flagellar motor component MotA